jgi:hypothetical protein
MRKQLMRLEALVNPTSGLALDLRGQLLSPNLVPDFLPSMDRSRRGAFLGVAPLPEAFMDMVAGRPA